MASNAFENGLLKHVDSSFDLWKSENEKVVLIYSGSLQSYRRQSIVNLVEKILNEGYYFLSGGIQYNGRRFEAFATFILKE